MAETRGLPVTVIGGYLGAGKTTLVNHLLRHAGRRIAVAVNDFGALPIDSDLIMGAEGNVLVLAGGCVCCSIGDDLLGGLAGLAARRDLDHVLVEASGVALPDVISRSIALVPGMALEATLVVVDCETVRENAADRYIGDTILRQLADADLVIANKADLVPESFRENLRGWLTAQAPRAEIVFVARGQAAPEIALGARDRSPFVCDEPTPHDLATLDSVSIELPEVYDVAALAAALADASLALVRAKGFARDISGAWKAMQIVGRRFEISDVAPREGAGRLVCIAHARKVEREWIAAAVRTARSPLP
jgi:G3E family GTPase